MKESIEADSIQFPTAAFAAVMKAGNSALEHL